MNGKAVSGIMLTLLFISMLTLAFNIQPAKAGGAIYIWPDGSVEPATAPISSVDNVTYTFTDNIYDGIVVLRSNIIIDGNGYTLQGDGTGEGFYLYGQKNVTIKNTKIKGCRAGIWLESSSYNIISSNNIAQNNPYGIGLAWGSCYNTISGNTIANNEYGIWVSLFTCYNTISGNTIAKNEYGIAFDFSYGNTIYHNNFVYNTKQVELYGPDYNIWDDGYPSGGNYWSDHTRVDKFSGPNQDELGADGIVDTPYYMPRDNYPLVKPYGVAHDIGITGITPSETSVAPGSMLDINIRVLNYGLFSETFNLTAYANTTVIGQTEVSLSSRKFATIAFTWDTTGLTLGTYTLKAQASIVPGETDTADNILIDGQVDINIHDIAVTAVTPSETEAAVGETIFIDVTVKNEGTVPETFNVTAYYDDTALETQIDITVDAGMSTTLTFTWDTGCVDAGDYTIKAQASFVPGETDTADNTFIDGQVTLSLHDIAVTQVTRAPTSVKVGDIVHINVTVANQGSVTETFNVTVYANTSSIQTKTGISLDAEESITLEFSWNTTGVTEGMYTISAYASLVPNEIDTANNYFEDSVVTIVTPKYLTQKLIETIETWNLPEGTENSLCEKLEDVIHLLEKGNENGAIHKLMDFINQVEGLRGKKLTDDQADYLIADAQRIIDLIQG